MTEHVTCMALETMEEAEAQRLTFRHPEKYALICLWKSDDKQLWAVVPMPVINALMEAV